MKRLKTMWMVACFCACTITSAYGQRGFAIVVDPQSYKEARNEIEQYAGAIEKYQHLKVYTVIDKWGVPDSIRTELIKLYRQKNNPIEGAVFVGDIPIPMIRDAQHLTSAFKMNQKADWTSSSVPSDRYYDDFDLKFTYLKKEKDLPYFYYSLNADSQQFLFPEIYTGRIRPTDCNGTSRYEKLKAYLNKVVAEKRQTNVLDNMLYFSGHGYISESVVARIDEKEGLYEHFPWLKQQKNGISYIDHNQEKVIKFHLMNELMRPELDYAILHHHGFWDTEYLSDIPAPANPLEAKEYIKSYARSHIRRAKERGKNTDSIMAVVEKKLDIPHSWVADTFDPAIIRKDSLADDELDLHISDFKTYGYQPNCRVVMIDACFCGSFHKDDCIANEYIFNQGKTIACIANTVNVLQDKWSDRYMGLLGLGVCVGDVARYSGYLESHLIGDPTFEFASSEKGIDVNKLLADRNYAAWRKILKTSKNAELQCMAIEQLNHAGLITSKELLQIFQTSTNAIVRIQALTSLSGFRDDNFIKAIELSIDDSYEMVQRFGLRYLGQSGDERLIPSLIKVSISNNTSKRCNFNAMMALSFYPEDKLMAEFNKQFSSDNVKYIDKEEVGKKIAKAVTSSARKWIEDINQIIQPETTDKKRMAKIRLLRNYCPHYMIPQLLSYLQSCNKPDMQVMLLEALGWHKYSCMADKIASVALQMSKNTQLTEEVRNEALKTVNRLKRAHA